MTKGQVCSMVVLDMSAKNDGKFSQMIKSRWLATWLLCVAACAFSPVHGEQKSFRPGRPWLDTKGEHINAHGFNIVKHEGMYYWYGSHKIEGRTESEKNEAGVRCYVSKDLLNWENSGLVFSVAAEGQHEEVAKAGILDRPKVIFHQKSKTFVMYFKLYPAGAAGNTVGTDVAYVGVATSRKALGPFAYQGKFTGAASPNGSGDFAIDQDEKGVVYHVAVRKPDKALVVGRMSDDGLRPVGDYQVMEGITAATEAPALFRRKGKIYLLGSGSTGWKPNPARMFVANQITGPYRALGNPCVGVNPHNKLGEDKAFGGQSTFVMQAPWSADEWIAMFDIWNPEEPIKAGYIWLPLRFVNDNPVIRWQNDWKLGAALSQDEPLKGAPVKRDAHLIALNQVRYQQGKPMRFTAPLTEDGCAFQLRPAAGGEAVFSGVIRGKVGDFSACDVAD